MSLQTFLIVLVTGCSGMSDGRNTVRKEVTLIDSNAHEILRTKDHESWSFFDSFRRPHLSWDSVQNATVASTARLVS